MDNYDAGTWIMANQLFWSSSCEMVSYVTSLVKLGSSFESDGRDEMAIESYIQQWNNEGCGR